MHTLSYARQQHFQTIQSGQSLPVNFQLIGHGELLQSKREKERLENRNAASVIADVIRLLSMQAIALRGHDEGQESSNQGNFREFMTFLGKYNSGVNSWLTSHPGNCSWMSPEIQNEFIQILYDNVFQACKKEMTGKPYSVGCDEVSDISTKQWLSIMIRYVSDGCITERCIALRRIQSMKAEDLKVTLVGVLKELDLPFENMVGQVYDGASNMSGAYNGLQALVKELAPQAMYVWCKSHILNLVCQDSVEYLPEIKLIFDLLQLIYATLKRSPEKTALFRSYTANLNISEATLVLFQESKTEKTTEEGSQEHLKSTLDEDSDCEECTTARKRSGVGKRSMTSLSATRWFARADNLAAVVICYGPLIETFETLSVTNIEASGIVQNLSRFETVFFVLVFKDLFTALQATSEYLQKSDMDMLAAIQSVNAAKKYFRDRRVDLEFTKYYESAIKFCEEFGVGLDAPHKTEAELPPKRKRRVNQHLVGDFVMNSFLSDTLPLDSPFIDDPKYALRVRYFLVIDQISSVLESRFSSQSCELMSWMMAFANDQMLSNELNNSRIRSMCKLWKFSEIDTEIAISEYALVCLLPGIKDKCRTLKQLLKYMHATKLDKVYTVLCGIIIRLCTLPVTSAGNERCHSKLKLVKSYLRNTMGDDRCESLVFLNVERDLTSSLSLDDVVSSFAQKPRKLML